MKKRDLASLVMVMASAFLLIASCPGQSQPKVNPQNPAGMGGAPAQMTQDVQAFYNGLSPDAQNKFNELDDNHRKMAMQMSQGPNAQDPNKAVEAQYNDQMNQ